MLNLVPEWTYHYGEFWKAIKTRNLWFIRLRYLASVVLFGFFITGQFLFHLEFSIDQIIAINGINISILLYNVLVHSIRKYVSTDPGKFNGLHLSLIQMILDLTALMLLVYYTGLIESPLYMFFIFHMIIGSLILPGYIIYLTAGLISCVFATLTLFQKLNWIQHHFIPGLYVGSQPHTLTYDILFVIIFAIMLFISVYIANKIAHQLYQREQQLRSSLEKLNEAEIAKQKYTIGIVHEIKTPIAAVHSILELIKNGYVGTVSELVEQKIQRAELRTEEALQLIKNILNISKLRLLEINLTDEINLSVFIKNLLDTFSELAKDKSINMIFIDNTNEQLIIKSDKILLELVVSNVISNALKYIEDEGTIEVRLDSNADRFTLEVCDNGIGIPQKDIDKIFEQFYRASNINKTIHEGSGMGLAIVKEIVEKLGGVIKVTSPSRLTQENRPGTNFEIIIPISYKQNEYDIFEVTKEDYLEN
ncbi:MAG: HAMP domain-containing sensor histidine kinase [Ignavibacteriales bacterium]|nr:HAMP domain-containing sensor histidine kinase [Ignavibacteriales bacterium]